MRMDARDGAVMRVAAPAHQSEYGCVDVGIVWQPLIGHRVRIRCDLDGRCPEGVHDWSGGGHTGIVVNVRGAYDGVSRSCLVVFDEPHPVMKLSEGAVELPARRYAAEELEPVAALGVRALPDRLAAV
jgi:hypothetical protein